jgi:hypothetical protein
MPFLVLLKAILLWFKKDSLSSDSYQEEFEDSKWVIKSCKSNKDRQYNGKVKKDKP